MDINDSGEVVGAAMTASGVEHAFRLAGRGDKRPGDAGRADEPGGRD
jgi:hypothetical protein